MIYQLTIDDYIGRWGYSKGYVRNVLAQHKGKHVDVKISSYGGELDHGLDIRQQFIDHGDVTVYLSGFVASSATVIAMGAKRIVMSKYAMFLVHKCSNFIDAWGSYNADQMAELIEQLTKNKQENDKIDVVLANMYADRCGKKVSEILDTLKEGRWLTAKEALDMGFIDEISEGDGEVKVNFTPELEHKFNAFGLSTTGLTVTTDEDQSPEKGLLQRLADSLFHRGSKSNEASDPEKPEDSADESPVKTEPKNDSSKMKKFALTAIAAFLAMDSIEADGEGYVSLSGENMEKVNNRLQELTDSDKEKTNTIASQKTRIAELEAQVKNLKEGPGDETNEIEDEGKKTATASELYNSIKDFI